MFQPAPGNVSFPKQEEETLEFWRERRVYEKTLQRRAGQPKFVFNEGPPTANGLPHPGHCLTRAIKDVFPRYRTMRGYYCERQAGWDTHGLPVEVEVCKELGIHAKEEIEAYGIEPFIHKCQASVWRYMKEWERLTERIGFWIDLGSAYVTYHQTYIESVWWSLKQLFDRGLLYKGHKIVWWWAQGGTALSAGEVGQGYREVADPSVYVRFPLVGEEDASLLVWTTTPWTLPSNQFAAVHADMEYARVSDDQTGQRLILAAALVETLAKKLKRELTVEETFPGSALLGKRYIPPFNYYYQTLGKKTGALKEGGVEHLAWRVVAAEFVTLESGTGVVHQAPAFGEDDFNVLQGERARFQTDAGPELICAVGPDGRFTTEAGEWQGRWVKDADKEITRNLRDRGLLVHQEQYIHNYPFCWRADQDPLIQYPRESWFIRTTAFRDRMLENNRRINWLPEHIRDGRFGNFLESNVDWALSRERYWGTPLPIWVCEKTGMMEAVANYDDLLKKPGAAGAEVWEQAKQANPELVEDLKVHKPYIDAVTYDSPFAHGARMRRVPEVIDCWYDSGAMPFAQLGYPHCEKEKFEQQFPADFISEAIDQTRGWFYSQLAISTMLFGDEQHATDDTPLHEFPHPFRNCIVLGLMLAEVGVCDKCEQRYNDPSVAKCEKCGGNVSRRTEKMSKKLRNYREPQEIFDRYGADALRWYFFANQTPWSSIIYSERAIKEKIPEFLLRLWNVFSFFVSYSNTSGFDPADLLAGEVGQLKPETLRTAAGYRPLEERNELDRWVLSELNRTAAAVVERMDAYDNFVACARLNEFVDALSNWYVRRSRDRFWENWRREGESKAFTNLDLASIPKLDAASREKLDGYWTLYECLTTVSKLIAPFTPFLAEALWRNLTGVFGPRAEESVHLCDYPTGNASAVDAQLSDRMRLVREIASLGLSVRADKKLKVRQPLSKAEVILSDTLHQEWLESHDALLRDELNVKQIEYTQETEKYVNYQVVPNFRLLGPQLGKLMPKVQGALKKINPGELLASLNATGEAKLTIDGQEVTLSSESIEVRLQAKEGWAAAQGHGGVVVLSTELTPDLLREGYARDLVRFIQERRKEMNCQYDDRIAVVVGVDAPELGQAFKENEAYIRNETLAVEFAVAPLKNAQAADQQLAGQPLTLDVQVAGA
jgi:isoleucyl-tRNA synthetase